jgi:predicted acylesterase/phospholipase RssA
MKALVLSGGGALGAYEAGVIRGLFEKGASFDLICGTSIGALNASFVAQGRLQQLETIWSTIGASPVITPLPIVDKLRVIASQLLTILGGGSPFKRIGDMFSVVHEFIEIHGGIAGLVGLLGLLDPNPIASIIQNEIDFGRLQSALIVSATNLTFGQSDAFYWFPNPADAVAFADHHDKGTARPLNPANINKAIQASASIPFAFAPLPIPFDAATPVYVDGGVANNTPIGVAIDAGATDVTVIFLNPRATPSPQTVDRLDAVGIACFGIMQQRILDLDFANAVRVNTSVTDGTAGTGSTGDARRAIRLCQIRPSTALPLSVLQFNDQTLIDAAYYQGYADGLAAAC